MRAIAPGACGAGMPRVCAVCATVLPLLKNRIRPLAVSRSDRDLHAGRRHRKQPRVARRSAWRRAPTTRPAGIPLPSAGLHPIGRDLRADPSQSLQRARTNLFPRRPSFSPRPSALASPCLPMRVGPDRAGRVGLGWAGRGRVGLGLAGSGWPGLGGKGWPGSGGRRRPGLGRALAGRGWPGLGGKGVGPDRARGVGSGRTGLEGLGRTGLEGSAWTGRELSARTGGERPSESRSITNVGWGLRGVA